MTIASKINFLLQLAALAAVVAFTVDLVFQAIVTYVRLRRNGDGDFDSPPKSSKHMRRLRLESSLLVGGVVALSVGILSLEPGRSTTVLTASFGTALAFLGIGVFFNNRRREDSLIDHVRRLRAELNQGVPEAAEEPGIVRLDVPKPKGLEAQLALAGLRKPGAVQRFRAVRFMATSGGAALAVLCVIYVKAGISGPMLAIAAIITGFLAPGMWLDYKIRQRRDEFLYYIPFAAESFAIAVSGALDVGAAIQHLAGVARTRSTINPVIEVLEKVKTYVATGLSIPEALRVAGAEPGIPQATQFFGTLAQFAQHGGEISKQVIELAGAVERERYLQVEYQIARMPVKATGPLAVFFAGAFMVLLAGLFAYLFEAVKHF